MTLSTDNNSENVVGWFPTVPTVDPEQSLSRHPPNTRFSKVRFRSGSSGLGEVTSTTSTKLKVVSKPVTIWCNHKQASRCTLYIARATQFFRLSIRAYPRLNILGILQKI
jgi:hypothetical protein